MGLRGAAEAREPAAACICTGVLAALIPGASGTMQLLSKVIKRPELLSSTNRCPPVLRDIAAGRFLNNRLTNTITCCHFPPPNPQILHLPTFILRWPPEVCRAKGGQVPIALMYRLALTTPLSKRDLPFPSCAMANSTNIIVEGGRKGECGIGAGRLGFKWIRLMNYLYG